MRFYKFFLYTTYMYYLVGLGNPGEKYADTRHNVGWLALDHCIEKWGLPNLIEVSGQSGRVTDGMVTGAAVSVLYPDTYMNNSGSAVVKFLPRDAHKNLVVVHDDIDLPFGEIKVSYGKGGGGNGVQSIIQKLDTKNFIRVRIGIAPTSFWTGKTKRPAGGGPLERFVLKEFGKAEQKQLNEVFIKVQKAIELILKEGHEHAMNKCN